MSWEKKSAQLKKLLCRNFESSYVEILRVLTSKFRDNKSKFRVIMSKFEFLSQNFDIISRNFENS